MDRLKILFIFILFFNKESAIAETKFEPGSIGAAREKAKKSPVFQCSYQYGKQICGYNCKTINGDISCNSKIGESDDCLSYNGQTECGINCRIINEKILCD